MRARGLAPAAAAWTTRSWSTTTRCSTATACATTTSSSSTRSSTRSATCYIAGQPLLAAYTRLQVGPCAEQQAAARAAGATPALRDRHLRRRGPRARRPGRAGARLVSAPGSNLPMTVRMTVFRWIVGVLARVLRARRGLRLRALHRLRVPALAGAGAALRHWIWLLALFWFNVEVWGRVVWTIWHLEQAERRRRQRPRKPRTSGRWSSKSLSAWSLPSISAHAASRRSAPLISRQTAPRRPWR